MYLATPSKSRNWLKLGDVRRQQMLLYNVFSVCYAFWPCTYYCRSCYRFYTAKYLVELYHRTLEKHKDHCLKTGDEKKQKDYTRQDVIGMFAHAITKVNNISEKRALFFDGLMWCAEAKRIKAAQSSAATKGEDFDMKSCKFPLRLGPPEEEQLKQAAKFNLDDKIEDPSAVTAEEFKKYAALMYAKLGYFEPEWADEQNVQVARVTLHAHLRNKAYMRDLNHKSMYKRHWGPNEIELNTNKVRETYGLLPANDVRHNEAVKRRESKVAVRAQAAARQQSAAKSTPEVKEAQSRRGKSVGRAASRGRVRGRGYAGQPASSQTGSERGRSRTVRPPPGFPPLTVVVQGEKRKAITHEASGAPARKSPTPAHKQAAQQQQQKPPRKRPYLPTLQFVWIRGDCKGATLDSRLLDRRIEAPESSWKYGEADSEKKGKAKKSAEKYKKKQKSAPSASLGAPVSQETEQQEEPMETDFSSMPPLEGDDKQEMEEGSDEDIAPTPSEAGETPPQQQAVKKLFGLVKDWALRKQQPIENDPLLNEPDPSKDVSAWLNWRLDNTTYGHPVLSEWDAFMG